MVTKETLRKLLSALKPLSEEQDTNAAVALILKPAEGDFEFLLVKRALRASDVWSGQMAFPGGKREPEDATLKDTVIRETMEETCIDVSGSCFLGVLEAVKPIIRNGFRVLPFVVMLETDPEVRLNHNELHSHMWVSYEKVRQSSTRTTMPRFGETPAFIFQDAVVWGMTHKILYEFSKTVEALKAS
ncbi:MAG: CoA pyrophosphatase [Candidatus Bathyarchaeota archaeon]|nr:CoA pyrophosphatase [Candidatus Bathyarchaeota archaeon]